MNQKGRKKGRESLPHRIAAILYSILLVLSLVPNQAFAEARDEVIDLMDGAAVELNAQSDDEGIQALDSEGDDEEAVVVANDDEGDDEEAVVVANDDGSDDEEVLVDADVNDDEEEEISVSQGEEDVENPAINLEIAKPVYDINNRTEEVQWDISFVAPYTGYPAPTTLSIDYPANTSGQLYYDVLTDLNSVSIVQSMPEGEFSYEIIPQEKPENPQPSDIVEEVTEDMFGEEYYNELHGKDNVIPIKDNYVIKKRVDDIGNEVGFDVIFLDGIRNSENDRLFEVRFWTLINQDWLADKNASSEHWCNALLEAGDPTKSNYAGYMTATEKVDIPHVNCTHPNPPEYKSIGAKQHRWLCKDCGLYRYENHDPQKIVITPATDTTPEVAQYQCKDCGQTFVMVEYKESNDGPVVKTDLLASGTEIIMPECTYDPPQEGQTFDKWDVQTGNEAKQLVFPGESAMLLYNTTITARWLDSITYIDENGEPQVVPTYEKIDESTSDLPGGWYVVQGTVDLSTKTTSIDNGVVNLVLCDGAELKTKGIVVKGTGELNLYGQSEKTGKITAASYYGIRNYNKVNMYSGVITGAEAAGLYNSGILNFSGGTITGNGKGIDQSSPKTAELNVWGSPQVYGNSAEVEVTPGVVTTKKDDITLPEGMYINVVGKLNDEAELWVLPESSGTGVITSGYRNAEDDYGNPTNPTGIFVSDHNSMAISRNLTENGEVQTEKAVAYIDENGERTYATHCTTITDSTTTFTTEGKENNEAWYALENSVTLLERLQLVGNGTINIILCDGAVLNCPEGVRTVTDGLNVKVWGQDDNSGVLDAGYSNYAMGEEGLKEKKSSLNLRIDTIQAEMNTQLALYAAEKISLQEYTQIVTDLQKEKAALEREITALGKTVKDSAAGIGADANNITNFEVYGGKVYAKGGTNAAGIGGGNGGPNPSAGTITIYGGEVIAVAGTNGAGIGGGYANHCPKIYIKGGKVTASGGDGRGAGIGGGHGGVNDVIEITGGEVIADGGASGGAAIGSGDLASQAGKIKIGGTAVVDAKASKHGAGIGTGDDTESNHNLRAGEIEIYGSANVVAEGNGSGAGIGGGDDSQYGGKITIKDNAVVTAIGGENGGAGIGGGKANDYGNGKGGDVTIAVGTTVEAWSLGRGAAIGAAKGSSEHGTISIPDTYMVSYADEVTAGKRTCLGDERENKTREGYAKIEQCDHKGVTGQDQTRYTSRGDTHIKVCMLCKTDLGIQEEHTGGAICEKCGFGEDEYSYIDENGQHFSLDRSEVTSLSVSGAKTLTGTSSGKWYCADGTMTVDKRVEITDKVNLILRDGCKITFSKGIHLTDNAELNIYGQTGESGTLEVPETGVDNYLAGIGGNYQQTFGTLNIRGGRIYVYGGKYAAGIGTGDMGGSETAAMGGTVNIYRGTVEATGGVRGAGIGGGSYGRCENINIYGGTVTAKSGDRGDTRTANAAGIGGGVYAPAGTITIVGGDVKAESTGYGAGIGAGGAASTTSSNGKVTISGGLVDAKCEDYGAGIGGGYGSNGCEVTITGGTVNARGNNGAGIGGGVDGSGQKVNITGGTVDATSQSGGAGIGSGPNKDFASEISITGGTVTAGATKYNASVKYGAGIGAGYKGKFTGKLTISGSKTKVNAIGGLYAASIGGGAPESGTTACGFTGELSIQNDAVVEMWNIGASHIAPGQLAVGYFEPFVAQGKPNEYQDYLTTLNSHIKLYAYAKVITDANDDSVLAKRDQRAEGLATSGYAKVMPCKHTAKEWVSTDDVNHWERCVYCMAEGKEDGIGTIAPHEFVFSSSRTCTCGKQGREIDYEAGYGSGVMAREFRAIGSNYTVPACTFVAPTDGNDKATFAGWRVNNVYDVNETGLTDDQIAKYQGGMTSDQVTKAKSYENKIVQPGEIIYIPARVLNSSDSKDQHGIITLTALWTDPRGIPYTNLENGTSYAKDPKNMSTITDVSGVSIGETGKTKWYYVDKNITYTNRIVVKGDVNLILGDAQTIVLEKGINVSNATNAKLTIWAQKDQTGTLKATSQSSNAETGVYNAAIGGDTNQKAGDITINGGVVSATGGKSERDFIGAAGIGGGANGGITTITINRGTVTANGMSREGAGIGNGGNNAGNSPYLSSGTIVINGGNVTANGGEDAAGIGGAGIASTVKSITINGGVVSAKGGKAGPGIGCGREGSGAYDVTICGDAQVTATGGADGAGIGSGKMCTATGTVEIGGNAKVTATGGAGSDTNGGGSGIGGGLNAPAAVVVITDSAEVTASNGTPYSANADPAGRYPIGAGFGSNSNGRIELYNDAAVYTKYKSSKTDDNGKTIDILIKKYATNEQRIDWCTQRNNVTILPCNHKYQEITYYDSAKGEDVNLKPYQAKYTATEDQSKHVLDCMFCNCEEDEPSEHIFNTKGVCGKCGASSYQVEFDANGGTGTFRAVSVALGEEYTLPKCPFKGNAGERFAGWTIGSKEYTDESQLLPTGYRVAINESIKLYAQWKAQPTLTVWSATWGLETPDIAHIEIAQGVQEYYEAGKDVTIVAPSLPSYDFYGWYKVIAVGKDEAGKDKVLAYDEDEPVSQNNSYTFAISEDTNLIAIYDQKAPVTVTVSGINNAEFYATGSSAVQNHITTQVNIGSKFTIKGKDTSKVLQFLNENKNPITSATNGEYTFTVTRSETIYVEYKYDEVINNQSNVRFLTSYGQVLETNMYIATDKEIHYPTAPSKLGYKFKDWVFADEKGDATEEGAGPAKANATDRLGEQIFNKISEGVATITLLPRYDYYGNPVSGSTKTLVKYVDKYKHYITKKDEDSIKKLEDQGFKYGDAATIYGKMINSVKKNLADENKSKVFDHIEDSKGNVLSYGDLPIVITSNKQYYVVFTEPDEKTPENMKTNIITQFEPVPDDAGESNKKVKGIMNVTLKEGWTIVDCGFVYAFNNKDSEELQYSTIVLDSDDVVKPPYTFVPKEGATYANVRVNVPVGRDVSKKVTLRAFAHIENTETKQIQIIYSNIISTTYKQLVG